MLVIIIIISSIRDQVDKITATGLLTTYVSGKQSTATSIKQSNERGEFQIIYVLLSGTEWRNMLS